MNYKAFKFLLKPTSDQEQTLVNWMGASRWIWNWCLTENKTQYQINKKFIFRYDLKSQLPKLKKQYPWLKDIPSQALQNRVIDFDSALRRVWRQGNGFPKYKSKQIEHHNTFRIDQTNGHIKPSKKQIQIPKMGCIRWIRHRPIEGKLKNITIKRQNNRWWCVVLCEIPDTPKQPINKNNTVGIDLGLTTFAVLSDGTEIATPKYYRSKQQKLKRAQQRLARKQRASANRRKAVAKLGRIHEKIKNQRHNFIHQHSRKIANLYSGVYVEDLNIEAIKQRYGKSTSDQGWAMFVNALAYKCNHLGKIDRWAASTKTCSKCGTVHQMSLSDREMKCDCGHHQSRDLNAARNIRIWGVLATDAVLFDNTSGTEEIYACGDINNQDQTRDWSSYVSIKQEKFLTFGKEAVTSLDSQ